MSSSVKVVCYRIAEKLLEIQKYLFHFPQWIQEVRNTIKFRINVIMHTNLRPCAKD